MDDSPSVLASKHVVLGVTGSIAAYKAAALASHLTRAGALVDVIMTASAMRLVAPLTFQTLTGRPVYTDMWEPDTSGELETPIAHVGLAHRADLLLIAPITAHTIARIALGLADDLLSLTVLAAACPVVIVPAMDAGMFENPATQAHLEALHARGVYIAGPAVGRMASGLKGRGRFLEPDEIAGHCRRVLGRDGALAGRRVVVTAGPTREPLDPVRFLSNYSSGRQGFAIAQAAVDAGADVTLIAGPVGEALPTPVGVERIDVPDARAMRDAVLAQATGDLQADALIMAAAVSDFRPESFSEHKIRKADAEQPPHLALARNPDILLEVSEQAGHPRVTVGFAAESHDLVANARQKLAHKKLDLIVANDITAHDAGFAADTNRVLLITADSSEELPLMSKAAVAARIVDWVAVRLGGE